MPGAISVNKSGGARSEALAEYFFSRWGPVLRGRDDSDYGVDLYCALAEEIGERLLLRDHYTVQVKSNRKPWEFRTNEAVEWFIAHPSPLFLAVVDKKAGSIEVFQTFARFDLWASGKRPASLSLRLGPEGAGAVNQWDTSLGDYDLGAPILKITAVELFNDEVLEERKRVLVEWIKIEKKNILLRASGLMRFLGPATYTTNSSKFGGSITKGQGLITDEQLETALHMLGECLDCVGFQLAHRRRPDEADAVVLALLLLRLLSDRGRKTLGLHPGIPIKAFEDIASRINLGESYTGQRVDELLEEVSKTTGPLADRLRRWQQDTFVDGPTSGESPPPAS